MQNIKDNIVKGQSDTVFLSKLKRKLPEYFTENEEFNLEKFKFELNKHNIRKLDEVYQLDFVGKQAAIQQVKKSPPVKIIPDEEHNKNEGKDSENIFFTGDNLDALRYLQNTYQSKIDVIYIDPPYNKSGSGFIYSDKFNHSEWLAFMYPRLALARKLLTDKGCIMISIDKCEAFDLTGLLNEIFGENNFVGQVIRKTRSALNSTRTGFNQQHEFLYIYSKNIDSFKIQGEPKTFEGYANPDNDSGGLWKKTSASARSGSDTTAFAIKNPYTGRIDYPPKGRFWSFSKSTMANWIKSGKFVFKRDYKAGERGFFIKTYLKDLKSKYKPVDSLFGVNNKFMNQAATRYLRDEIFEGKNIFTSPKPVDFIEKLLEYSTKKDSIVLDFFAGSATTAEAVMRLNASDGGQRKFILVQLPEKTYYIDKNGNEVPTKGGKIAYNQGFKSIDKLSMERIKRSAKKIKKENELLVDFDSSFKHYYVVSLHSKNTIR